MSSGKICAFPCENVPLGKTVVIDFRAAVSADLSVLESLVA